MHYLHLKMDVIVLNGVKLTQKFYTIYTIYTRGEGPALLLMSYDLHHLQLLHLGLV